MKNVRDTNITPSDKGNNSKKWKRRTITINSLTTFTITSAIYMKGKQNTIL